jgi:3-oxoacyl-[acyl-carrier protein] reductase
MKTVLVTGSSQGIGLQIGLDLLKSNYFVYFNARTKDSLIKMARNWNYEGSHCDFIPANLSNIKNIIKITDSIVDLDVLVLNIGITDRTPFEQINVNDWDSVFNTNLKIPFFLVQALRNKIAYNGRIIFISSISGYTTDSTSIHYGVSKGAINHLVPYLAKEFADRKITVNAIAPGYIDTNWHLGKSPEQIKRIESKCLANRLGTVQEISKAVVAIINNDFINAQVIRVDGGFLV